MTALISEARAAADSPELASKLSALDLGEDLCGGSDVDKEAVAQRHVGGHLGLEFSGASEGDDRVDRALGDLQQARDRKHMLVVLPERALEAGLPAVDALRLDGLLGLPEDPTPQVLRLDDEDAVLRDDGVVDLGCPVQRGQ